MKDKSDIKPDFISFYRSEWRRETKFIHCRKTGKVFEQLHQDRHRLIYCVLFIVVLIIGLLSIILLPAEAPKIIKSMPYLLLILLVSLYPIVTYNISRYKLIEDEELIKKHETDEDNVEDQR